MKRKRLCELALKMLGIRPDSRTGAQTYFLIKSLALLAPQGRLAIILPSDVFERRHSSALWKAIAAKFSVDAVLTFSPEATPFPNQDTNPVVVFIKRAPPTGKTAWARCERVDEDRLARWVESGFAHEQDGLTTLIQDTNRLFDDGATRPLHRAAQQKSTFNLGDFADVMRGIATGDNRFFLMTSRDIAQRGLPMEYFVRAIRRTRDLDGDVLTDATLESLDQQGVPTYLLSLDAQPLESLPPALQEYLRAGMAQGVHLSPLISTRTPWYRMERRVPPPILFRYLGRSRPGFVLNRSCAVPLALLCVYPKPGIDADALYEALSREEVLEGMSAIGRSYGNGAIKVEPKQLLSLPIPDFLVPDILRRSKPQQPLLFFDALSLPAPAPPSDASGKRACAAQSNARRLA